jgi:3-deoxy-D-manno-octulosonic-acid transferase
MHASSVGEGLQARPVLERLRSDHPHLQLAYTFFSPSAERFARSLDADFAEYLPFDSRGDARVALDALSPHVLAFSKLDVWPALVATARARGVRTALLSATLAHRSRRRSRISGMFTRGAYAAFDAVGAIDEADAMRLLQLGVRERAITVTGDTRYDQVWARVRAVDHTAGFVGALSSDRPTLVAGSTWPTDERPLLAAWSSVRLAVPRARLIIAPHEPTEAHLAPVERWAADAGLRAARLAAPEASTADVVIVDRVGVLGDLYALASVAYVGGGFHAAGLHSVLEPAAFGVPVLFGPRFANSRDAELLMASGGGASGHDAAGLERRLSEWLSDDGGRAEAGHAARALVERGLGAAERSWQLVAELLGDATR